jgi:hypothetical protein
MPASDQRIRHAGRWARLGLAALLALAGARLILADRERGKETPAECARRLSAAHGIALGIGPPDTFFVPPHGPVSGVEAQPVDPESAATALEGIERALAQYPAGFVAGLIKAVFVSGELRVGGVEAGGTYGPAWIILAAPKDLGREGIFATSYIGVHHELSSLALEREPSTRPKWERFAPAGWKFETAPAAVIAREHDGDPDPATGFLSAYGGTNAENDFNVYVEKIFTEPATVARLARAHALIRRKLEFVIAVYVRIDPRMAAVFHELGVQ